MQLARPASSSASAAPCDNRSAAARRSRLRGCSTHSAQSIRVLRGACVSSNAAARRGSSQNTPSPTAPRETAPPRARAPARPFSVLRSRYCIDPARPCLPTRETVSRRATSAAYGSATSPASANPASSASSHAHQRQAGLLCGRFSRNGLHGFGRHGTKQHKSMLLSQDIHPLAQPGQTEPQHLFCVSQIAVRLRTPESKSNASAASRRKTPGFPSAVINRFSSPPLAAHVLNRLRVMAKRAEVAEELKL